MEIIALLIVIIIITAVLFRSKKYLTLKLHQYNTVKNFDGPKAYPIIGNAFLFLGDLSVITNRIIPLLPNYILPARVWLGLQLFVILEDPDQIKIITESSIGLEKSSLYDLPKIGFGNGLITAPSSIWKIHRKLLNQTFTESILANTTEKIVKHSNRLVRIFESSNEKEIDILNYVQLCTMDIAYDTFVLLDLNLQGNPECKLLEYFTDLVSMFMERACKIWLRPDIIYYNLPVGKRLQNIISHVNKITKEVIRKKKESIRKNEIRHESRREDSGNDTSAFLDSLFESFYHGGEYTEKEIQDEINTFIFAGSDTTGHAVSFAFLMLAMYPEIQEKLYAELYDIYGLCDPEDVPITNQDIKKMKYLEQVIKETLRLFPSVPFIGRCLSEDIKVDENTVIPKKSQVVIMIYTLHRNEKYWSDPLQFNPDRFLPGNYNSKYFRPFGFVKRNCIGQGFAMLSMKIMIASALRKFIIRIDNPINIEDIPLLIGVTLKPANPVLLSFIKR
ncbi:hypothetical protein M0802_012411 [Mischocyttarus mexicanus]|nr:hypothetical protein M0802_012411 [Mischocyttarus mexicanus]